LSALSAHYEAARKDAKRNRGLGISAAVASAIVGTTVFATVKQQVDLELQILAGLVSISATVFAALQTTMAGQPEAHRSAVSEYDNVLRLIRRRQANLPKSGELGEAKRDEVMAEINQRLDSITEVAPTCSQKAIDHGTREANRNSNPEGDGWLTDPSADIKTEPPERRRFRLLFSCVSRFVRGRSTSPSAPASSSRDASR
jgi:hypothetical protein